MIRKVKQLLFQNRTAGQTVAKNAIWLSISSIGGRLIKVSIIIYAGRLFGAAGLGVFSYAVTVAGFLAILFDMGVNQIVIKSVAAGKSQEERSRFISTAFFIKLSLLVVGTLLILFAVPHLTTIEETKALLPLVAIIFIFDALREFGFALIKAMEKMEYEAALYLFTTLSISIFGFIFLSISPTVRSFALGYVAGTGVGAIATMVTLRHHFTSLVANFSKPLIKPILTLAWPFAISGLLGGLMLNTDVLMLGWYLDAENVGFYSAAQRIIQLLYLLPSILAVSALPIFSRLALSDKEKFRRLFERVVSVAFIAAIPIAVGGALLNRGIIELIWRSPFLPAAIPFGILVLTTLVDFPAVIFSNAFFAYNQHRKLIIYAAIGGGGNVLFNFLLIPTYGIIGCAIATLLAQIVSNIYLWHQMKKINTFTVYRKLGRMVLGALLMGAVVFGLDVVGVPVIASVVAGAVVYFAALSLLREPLLRDLKSILRSPT